MFAIIVLTILVMVGIHIMMYTYTYIYTSTEDFFIFFIVFKEIDFAGNFYPHMKAAVNCFPVIKRIMMYHTQHHITDHTMYVYTHK